MKYIILTLILCLPLIGFGQIDMMYEITDEKDSYIFSDSDIHIKKIEIKGEEINSLLEHIHLYDSIETLDIWEYDQRLLSKEQYKLISEVKTLHTLTFYRTNMGEIPYCLATMPSLKNLIISRGLPVRFSSDFFDSISIIDLRVVSSGVFDLPEFNVINHKLKYLSFNRNFIRNVPSNIKKLQGLERLDLSHNKLRNFPMEVLELESLRILDIGFNNIDSIPDEIYKLKNLETLFLTNNKIHQLPATFKKLESLEELLISGDGISNEEKSGIIKNLPKGCKITWTNDEFEYDIVH